MSELLKRLKEASVFQPPSVEDPRIKTKELERAQFEKAAKEIADVAKKSRIVVVGDSVYDEGLEIQFILTGASDRGMKNPHYSAYIEKDRTKGNWHTRFAEEFSGDERGDYEEFASFDKAVAWMKEYFSDRAELYGIRQE